MQIKAFLAGLLRPQAKDEDAPPPAQPEMNFDPRERVRREDYLRALERLRTDSPVAYEAVEEYLKNELVSTRRMKLANCQQPSWLIAHQAIWRETKCGVLESQISDLERTVDAINKPPVVEVWDVPPAGVEA